MARFLLTEPGCYRYDRLSTDTKGAGENDRTIIFVPEYSRRCSGIGDADDGVAYRTEGQKGARADALRFMARLMSLHGVREYNERLRSGTSGI